MSWLDDLFGVDDSSSGESNPNDKDVVLNMLMLSKYTVGTLTKATIQATNPQLRQILSSQLNNAINEHFSLSDMAINKQWYNVNLKPEQQIQQTVLELQNLS